MKKALAARHEQFTAKLKEAIEQSHLTRFQIATRLGYPNENIISLFLNGNTRVPTSKILRMANILNLDIADFTREWLLAYDPDALDLVEQNIGTCLTHNEQVWVNALRRYFRVVPRFEESFGPALLRLVEKRTETPHSER
jgi:transcriptional regulator with XRE-family HTH domain